MKSHFVESLTHEVGHHGHGSGQGRLVKRCDLVEMDGEIFDLNHGDVVIAAITSCTNTSNPWCDAGGRFAGSQGPSTRAFGQTVGQNVACSGKSSGYRILRSNGPAGRLECHGLSHRRVRLHHLHRQLWASRSEPVEAAIDEAGLIVGSVLSGNRNFEGRSWEGESLLPRKPRWSWPTPSLETLRWI